MLYNRNWLAITLQRGKTLPAGRFDKKNKASIDIQDKIIIFLNFINHFEIELSL